MGHRKSSGILISVLDLTALEKRAEKSYIENIEKEYGKPVYNVKLRARNKIGLVATEIGFIPINCAGVGQNFPIKDKYYSDENFLYIEFWQVDKEGRFVQGPQMTCPITRDTLNLCPLGKNIPLEDFIGAYSLTCEQRYDFWRSFFRVPTTVDPMEQTPKETQSNFEMETDEQYPSDEEEAPVAGLENLEMGKVYEKNATDVDRVEQSKWLAPTLTKGVQVKKYGSFLLNKKCECREGEALINLKKGICHCGKKDSHSHCKRCGCVL
jgi:hypothetical protein